MSEANPRNCTIERGAPAGAKEFFLSFQGPFFATLPGAREKRPPPANCLGPFRGDFARQWFCISLAGRHLGPAAKCEFVSAQVVSTAFRNCGNVCWWAPIPLRPGYSCSRPGYSPGVSSGEMQAAGAARCCSDSHAFFPTKSPPNFQKK